jgi:hypothetical protein
MIFNGDPGDRKGLSGFARFFYRPEFNRASIYVFHEILALRLDEMGQNGVGLADAYATVFTDLIDREIAEVPRTLVETEKRSTARTLEEELGFRVLDDEDYGAARFHNALAPDPASYWLVLNSGDDERYQQPIRYGQWPRATEIIVKQLWSRCVDLTTENAKRREIHNKLHDKLSISAGAWIIGSFAVPLLLEALRLVNVHQLDRLWNYGAYSATAGLGALIAGWWTSD